MAHAHQEHAAAQLLMSHDARPNPDELLASLRAEEARGQRGKLRIFLGYAAGVGKTYAMLNAAQRERAEGIDVVVGYVEPHGRQETEALLEGLEQLPPKLLSHRNVTLREFDLDAALARHPQLILVDELAHTNAAPLRHAKRWQDVEELLDAGINVYTTLNIQHIESLNDVISRITSVVVRETLPDSVLEQAHAFELIDITPEELIERLRAGKVYVPEQAERALRHFFQPQNLTALRELSLREAANRLRLDKSTVHESPRKTQPWATSERLLVCVGPSPTTARLIRAAKRMASAFGAEWLALAVEVPGKSVSADEKARIAQHLRLAEQLGATTHSVSGTRVAETVLEFARSNNVARIVIGKTAQPWWKRMLLGTVVDNLLDQSGAIDIYVIQGESEAVATPRARARPMRFAWHKYLAAACMVAGSAGVAMIGQRLHSAEANVVMVFLLGVVWTAYRNGRGPGIFAAVASVLVFDFLFVPPYFTFAVGDAQYLFTFGVMLVIGLTISTLTVRLSEQLLFTKRQERRTAALFQLTKQLSEVQGTDFLANIAGQRLAEIFEGEAVIYTLQAGKLTPRYGGNSTISQLPQNMVVAQWVAEHEQIAGQGTDTLPSAPALFVPLIGSQRIVGAIGIRAADESRLLDPEQRRLLTTCASLVALAIERDWSLIDAQDAQVKAQAEQLRSSLLSSVSHDLRTPLSAIAGAASDLLRDAHHDEHVRRELLEMIAQESHRLNRLIENLLNMTRLDTGSLSPSCQWHVLEEVVGSAIRRSHKETARHSITAALPTDLPLVWIDDLLLETVLVNLLENAARHTPAGGKIEISAEQRGKQISIRVADNGPGIPAGWEAKIFGKFVRGATTIPDGSRGSGLGLAICKAIVESHGGTITAQNRPTGGAEFLIRLPHHPERVPASAPT